MVMLPVILLHRNPRIWGDDALEFKPERFAEGVLKAANGHAAFIPFGWGVRNCIGANLAVWVTKVFVALMLRKFFAFEVSQAYAHAPLVSLNMQPQYDEFSGRTMVENIIVDIEVAQVGDVTPSIFKNVNCPVILKFHNVAYNVRIEQEGYFNKKKYKSR
ncbi:hypothetical protein CASFOL_036735 [Castilleja foliolosa]|uniref:Cytochrome P450 n=1 Tax=Castilleja foliolosa TaxID=1961234 RepID=A0ABD3BR45_9LAMI